MSFKLPIHYCSKKTTFSNLYDDLELLEKGNMYKYLFKPSTILGEQMLKQWSEFYTTDTAFLKDSQYLLFFEPEVTFIDDIPADDVVKSCV